MTQWNPFGRYCSGMFVVWSTGALLASYYREWNLAETLGILSWVAFSAQWQWGRA